MSSIFICNKIYYYKSKESRFSLRTKNKVKVKRLQKEYDKRFRLEEAIGETLIKQEAIYFKPAMENYL